MFPALLAFALTSELPQTNLTGCYAMAASNGRKPANGCGTA